MEKTVEKLITEIEKNNKVIETLLAENKKLAIALKDRPDEEWDWVSVSTACKQWDISPAKMYAKINDGKLTTKRFDQKNICFSKRG